MRLLSLFCFFGCILINCKQKSDPLTQIVQQDEQLYSLAKDPFHQVQVIYTQVDRDSLNYPTFTTFTYNQEADQYFYPASTVKLPSVLIAFEKMNKLGIPINARMEIDSAYSRQTAVNTDSTAPNLEPSIAHYAKKILLASDNDAYNRLYEFIGQDAFNNGLSEKGYPNSRITHRLSISRSKEENARSNPMRFYVDDELVYEQEMQTAKVNYNANEPIFKGEGYWNGSEVVNAPFDFSAKNYFPLSEQHQMIKAFIFPDQFPQHSFDLRPEDRELVLNYMSVLPRDSGIEAYQDTTHYWDAYVKFLMYGSEKGIEIPSHIRIYNKIGVAYGFTTDNAYVIDTINNIEFFISAVIHTNPNRIYNDGVYDYDSVAFPFMKLLGMKIYEYERTRERTYKPTFTHLLSY